MTRSGSRRSDTIRVIVKSGLEPGRGGGAAWQVAQTKPLRGPSAGNAADFRRVLAFMSTIHDLTVLLVVYVLAALYTAAVYSWFIILDDRSVKERPKQYLAAAIILGTLLLAVANNYLSALFGSKAASVALPLLPFCAVSAAGVRGARSTLLKEVGSAFLAAVGSTILCAVFILAATLKIYSGRSLSEAGVLHPDLPWHIGRVVEQAFQSSPGFWPLSPIAFPDSLPYQSFVADSLAAATLRYLPFQLHALNYSQVILAWAVVLWTSVVLINEGALFVSLIVLATSLLLVPALIWGRDSVGSVLMASFHSNPNSAIDWPIGVAVAFHLCQSLQRRAALIWAFVILTPPASLFFKVNAAFAFTFLTALGILLGLLNWSRREWIRYVLYASSAWVLSFGAALAVGRWPVSIGIRFSAQNFWHYAGAALPPLKEHSWSLGLITGSSYIVIVGVALLARFWLNRFTAGSTVRRSAWNDIVIPLSVLAAAMVYLLAGWLLIVPTGPAEGDPMHVNFELIMWLITVPVSSCLCLAYEAGSPRVLRYGIAGTVVAATSAMTWILNTRSPGNGGLPLGRDYNIAAEATFRDSLKSAIPDGNCFGYGRRYVIYTIVDGEFPPDFTVAATGCPQLNGTRWRGYLGDNRPELLARSSAIAAPSGRPFRVVVSNPCAPPGTPMRVVAAVSGKSVDLSWVAVPGAETYQIEVGSKPAWTDQGILHTDGTPRIEVHDVVSGLYFARVRAGNGCGKGGASDEIMVRID